MSAYAAVAERPAPNLAYVEADLHYLSPMLERPRNYTYDPPPGVPRSNTAQETHRVPIHDARGVVSDISLDREGFRPAAPCQRGAEFLRRGRSPEHLLSRGRKADRPRPQGPAAFSSSITPCAAGFLARMTAASASQGSRQHACMSITQPNQGRSGFVTFLATKPRHC